MVLHAHMKNKIASFLAAAAILACPMAASAQNQPATTPSADGGEIVVDGQRREVRHVLRDLIADADGEQLARMEQRLCPKVIGYPDDYRGHLERMIRNNAEAAGLDVEGADCRPNAFVIFIDDPQAAVEGLSKADRGIFGNMEMDEIGVLHAAPKPVIAWRVSELRAYDGIRASGVSELPNPQGGTDNTQPITLIRNAKNSRMGSNVRQDILMSFAVVDIDETVGKSLRQLADLATLHLLLNVGPDAESTADDASILRLFTHTDAASMPPRMSDFDKAMLSAMYSLGDNAMSSREMRGRMARQIKSDLETSEEENPVAQP